MKIKAKILEETKTVELSEGSTPLDLFKELGEQSEAFIVKRGSEIIIESEKLKNNDEIELIKIVSGG